MTDRTDRPTSLTGLDRGRIALGVAVLVLLVVAPVAIQTGTAQDTASASTPPADAAASTLPTESAFVVDLDADGSARVTVATTFDLTTDSERDAFEALRANETARERRTDRFATRLAAIAARAENSTGRTMEIRDPTMAFSTENDTGVVTLSVTWEGIVAQQDDRLVLRAPFDSGFEIDRPFRVIGPDGYALETASPTPATQHQHRATWNSNTELDGFETAFSPETDVTTGESTDPVVGDRVPGFGLIAAAVAILASTWVLVRHLHRK